MDSKPFTSRALDKPFPMIPGLVLFQEKQIEPALDLIVKGMTAEVVFFNRWVKM